MISDRWLLLITLACWAGFGIADNINSVPVPRDVPHPVILVDCSYPNWPGGSHIYMDTYSRKAIAPDGRTIVLQKGGCHEA